MKTPDFVILDKIITNFEYCENDASCLIWKKSYRQINIGDTAGWMSNKSWHIGINGKNFKLDSIIYYLHNQIWTKIRHIDGDNLNNHIDNLIPFVCKKSNQMTNNANKMKNELEISKDRQYSWKLQKDIIQLLDENEKIIRKFKNQFVQDVDFVTNVRIEIVLRFGINPKNLKEKD